ncbi:hypothetical protein N7517_008837 [Penicillium concentricum]|uniref:SnoaL-like domain-containing protein n=1 Tax=Penicillium concentricum TaxID=293559 RepID=A0A9W9V4H9_9EURO|nr:uncharacterized protein N7517_008837 [Penicillium concentricum]KAJ5365951.1 hypothetical protein N7517_008837 [Penicillium concentricum]
MTTASSEPDIELLNTRREDFLDAFNAADIDHVISLFAPDSLYSDYAIAALDMDLIATRAYLEKIFSEAENITLSPVSISGDKHFAAAEWVLTMKFKSSGNGDNTTTENRNNQGAAQEMEMRGVSLTWYDEDGKKIVNNKDYGVIWPQA